MSDRRKSIDIAGELNAIDNVVAARAQALVADDPSLDLVEVWAVLYCGIAQALERKVDLLNDMRRDAAASVH